MYFASRLDPNGEMGVRWISKLNCACVNFYGNNSVYTLWDVSPGQGRYNIGFRALYELADNFICMI